MKVKLIKYTNDPERTCAMAAKLCYSNSDIEDISGKMSSDDIKKIIRHILSVRHYSVLEHVSFTFGIEGVSRALTHQLVRHRIASFSQQSQRYVNLEKPSYIVPKTISKNKEAKKKFEETMKNLWKTYKEFVDAGIPKEDARFVLPNAASSKIIVTMNTRSLFNFFNLRCCNRAQWEIREMANMMLKEVKKVAPIIFENAGPPCNTGPCPEGGKSCGRWKKIRKEKE